MEEGHTKADVGPKCAGCHQPYSFTLSPVQGIPPPNRRLPFILDCGHTRCEECAKELYRPGKGVACRECSHVTPIKVKPGDNLKISIEQLELDYYIFGLICATAFSVKRYQAFSVRGAIVRASGKKLSSVDYDERVEVAAKFGLSFDNFDVFASVEEVPPADGDAAETTEENPINDAPHPEPPKELCGECSEVPATCFCKKCECSFCGTCFSSVHESARALRMHVAEALSSERPVVNVSAVGDAESRQIRATAKPPTLCQLHPNNSIDFFCKQDQSYACRTCVEYDHRQHRVLKLSEVQADVAARLYPATNRCHKLLNLMESSKKELEKLVGDIQADAAATTAEVRNYFQILHSLCQKREMELLKEVITISLDEIRPIQVLKLLMEEKNDEISNLLLESRELMKIPVFDPRPIVSKIDAALNFPIIVTHLPTSDKGIHFAAAAPDAVNKMLYNNGKLHVRNASARFRLMKMEESASDVMMSILENPEGATAAPAMSIRSDSSASSTVKSIEASQLRHGETVDVHLVFIDSPVKFYVHRFEDRPDIHRLVKELTRWANDSHNNRPLTISNIEPSYLYAARWTQDGQFYRVRVTRCLPNPTEPPPDVPDSSPVHWAEALFIDFGNVERIPITWFRELPSKFKNIPEKAFCCGLHGISPPKRASAFSHEALNKFHDMVRDKRLLMSVREKIDGIWQVDLHQAHSTDINLEAPLSVRDALVFLEFAVFTSNLSAPESIVPIHDSRRYLRSEVPPINVTVETYVSHIESPKEFYVQFSPSNKITHLQDMMRQLQQVYSSDFTEFYTLFCPQPGMVCAAKFNADEFWYRALVKEIIGKRTVEVEFVDYGNRQKTSIWNVKKLLDDFLVMTPLAIKCSLPCADICDYDETNLELGKRALERINDLTLLPESIFDGTIVSSPRQPGDPHIVQLRSRRVNRVDEAVKAAMEGGDDLKRFVADVEEVPRRSKSPEPRSDSENSPAQHRKSRSKEERAEKRKKEKGKEKEKEKNGDLPAGVRKTTKDQRQSITISHALRPDKFYIQISKAKDDLKQMEKRLKKECDGMDEPFRDWAVGVSCAAHIIFQEYNNLDKWCRVTILEALPGKKVRVNLLDTGKDKVVKEKDLREFKSDEFKTTNAFALESHLLNAYPSGGSSWSQVACEEFHDLVTKHETCFTKFVETAPNRFAIQLYIKNVESETALEPAKMTYEDVAELLIEKGLAFKNPPRFLGTDDSALPSPARIPSPANVPKLETAPPTLDPTEDSAHQAMRCVSSVPDLVAFPPTILEVATKPKPLSSKTFPVDLRSEDTSPETDEIPELKPSSSVPSLHDPTPERVSSPVPAAEPPLPTTDFASQWAVAIEAAAATSTELSTKADIVRDRSHEFPRWKLFLTPERSRLFENEHVFSAFVTYVDERAVIWATPSEIYDDNVIHEMTLKTQAFFIDQEPVDLGGELKVGQAVMAQYDQEDDDKWYRGRVFQIVDDGGVLKIDVTFIEFGNTERVLPHKIRTKINPTLEELPQMAVEMRLSHVRPLKGTKSYSADAISYIHNLLVGHTVWCRLTYGPNGLPIIDEEGVLLIDRCQREDESGSVAAAGNVPELGIMMVWSNYAEMIEDRPPPSTGIPRSQSQASLSSCSSNASSGRLHRGNLGEVATSDHLREARVKKTPGVVTEGFAKKTSERFMRMTAPDGVDFYYKIQVWGVDGFYYHYDIDHPQYDEIPVLVEKKRECRESINYEKFMQTNAHTWPFMKNPVRNMVCAAFWEQDGLWYRGQIIEPPQTGHQDSAIVAFVDWGNSDEVKVINLRHLPVEGLIPRRRSTKGMAAELADMSKLMDHPNLEIISKILTGGRLHGVLKKIEKAPTGEPQVYLSMRREGRDEFALKDFISSNKDSTSRSIPEDF